MLLPFCARKIICGQSSVRAKSAMVRRRGVAAARVRRDEGAGVPDLRRGDAFPHRFGATETAPATHRRVWSSHDAANMGVPPPGAELKLVPMEGRYEMRVKGPHVTPGYWRAPELTSAAFDEEGYYCLGDTFAFDRGEPPKGCFSPGASPRIQAPHRHLGARRRAARALHRALRAAGARRGVRRRGQERHRRTRFSIRRGVPRS